MPQSLLRELQALLTTVDEPMAKAFVPILERASPITWSPAPTPFPLDDVPDLAALANDATRVATQTITDAPLPWSQPPAEMVPPGWAHRAAACELVGPDGVISGLGDERCGIFYLSAGLEYPYHWHDAEEFYFVLAGSADWTVDGVTTRRAAGDWSHTPERAVHQIVTHDEPVLAAWGWAGDTRWDTYGY